MLLHLVRHGPPVIEPGRPASSWRLDTSQLAPLERLRDLLAAQLPSASSWFSSDEPKAVDTARLLTGGVIDVEIVPALREAHRSDWFADREDFRTAVRDGFAAPDRPARPGWEPLATTRQRISAAVVGIIDRHRGDVVLVGHGTAWTLLAAELTDQPPDVDAWSKLRAPDLCSIDVEARSIERSWGAW